LHPSATSELEEGTMPKQTRPASVAPTWVSYREALGLFLRGATAPTAAWIALVVGTWLSLMNQGRLVLHGHPPWVRIALNYLTPFVVASLGYLAARRRRNVERLVALLDEDPGAADESDDKDRRLPEPKGSAPPTGS
jgi:hypothetical protein